MLLDLIDALRCPAEHAETWLVLTADRWELGVINEGRLGCPVCHATYEIRSGVACFTADSRGEIPADRGLRPPALHGHTNEAGRVQGGATRLAAQLDLQEPGGIILLAGAMAELAESVADYTQAVFALVNPTSTRPNIASLRVGLRLPFASGSARAVALDDAHSTPHWISEAARVLRPGGRMVASAGAPLPAGVRELARDEHEWVGVSDGAPILVTLRRPR